MSVSCLTLILLFHKDSRLRAPERPCCLLPCVLGLAVVNVVSSPSSDGLMPKFFYTHPPIRISLRLVPYALGIPALINIPIPLVVFWVAILLVTSWVLCIIRVYEDVIIV